MTGKKAGERRAGAIERQGDAAARAEEPRGTLPRKARATPKPPAAPGEGCRAFLESMRITYDQWHDGIGYDLEALARVADDERRYIAAMLLQRVESGRADWRDIEALGALDLPEAATVLKEALRAGAPEIRLHIARMLLARGVAVEIDQIIADILRLGRYQDGLSLALDLAAVHATPYLRNVLLDCALDGHPDVRAHAAALCLYLAGKAAAPFDLRHRPFFLKFGEEDRAVRREAFEELCRRIGATGGRWPEVRT